MLNIKREKNKTFSSKSSENNNRQVLFDNIDIVKELSIINYITKTPLENFLYNKEVLENPNFISSKAKITSRAIVTQKVTIYFEDLNFESKNHKEYLLTDIYEIISVLGEGSFGVVVEARLKEKDNFLVKELPAINKDKYSRDKRIALKIIQVKNNKLADIYKEEARLLMELEHDRIVKVFSMFENNNYIVIEMECMQGESMKTEIIKCFKDESKDYLFSEEASASIIKGLIEGLAYLHRNNVFHRDIKPENLMFLNKNDYNSLKIIDLGLAAKFDSKLDMFHDSVGTLYFMAPEVISSTPSYNYLVDSWACGIVLYIILSGGEHPLKPYNFWSKNSFDEKEFTKVLLSKSSWSFPKDFPK